jgi:hypothetical protein
MRLQFYHIFPDAATHGTGIASICIMKERICFLLNLSLLIIVTSGRAQKTYDLIARQSGKVNIKLAASLPPEIKAMAAFYSAMGGTDCIDQECVLTTALGLGKQGSDEQKTLIRKYLPDDKVARLVLGQDCYLPPASSISFSNFLSLSILVIKDTFKVNYRLAVYNQGNMKIIQGPDIYFFKNQVFKNKKRVLYAWTDK